LHIQPQISNIGLKKSYEIKSNYYFLKSSLNPSGEFTKKLSKPLPRKTLFLKFFPHLGGIIKITTFAIAQKNTSFQTGTLTLKNRAQSFGES